MEVWCLSVLLSHIGELNLCWEAMGGNNKQKTRIDEPWNTVESQHSQQVDIEVLLSCTNTCRWCALPTKTAARYSVVLGCNTVEEYLLPPLGPRWRQYFPSKQWCLPTIPQCIKIQKTNIYVFNVMTISYFSTLAFGFGRVCQNTQLSCICMMFIWWLQKYFPR